jgi:hypothetical protein
LSKSSKHSPSRPPSTPNNGNTRAGRAHQHNPAAPRPASLSSATTGGQPTPTSVQGSTPTAQHRKPVQSVDAKRLTRGGHRHDHQKPPQLPKREDLSWALRDLQGFSVFTASS